MARSGCFPADASDFWLTAVAEVTTFMSAVHAMPTNTKDSAAVTTRIPRLATALAAINLMIASGASAADSLPPISDKAFDCEIEAEEMVKLASSALGVVAELKVDRGDIVHTGQVLGKLNDTVEAATLALAQAKAVNNYDILGHKARLEWLRKKLARAVELGTGNISSKNTRDEDEADVKVEEQQLNLSVLQQAIARLDAQQAEAVLQLRSFISPVDGVVVERLLSVGEYRNDQSPIMTLAQINPLRVEVFVPTIYYGQIAVGSVGQVQPEEPISGTYAAKVTVVDKVMDAASGTFGVRLSLPNPNLALPAGLKCKIRFDGTVHEPPQTVTR
jgi:RND family efflux transporter MFP subunit